MDTAYKEQEMLNNIKVDGLSIDSDEEPSRRNSNDNNNNTENNTNSNNNDSNNNNLPKQGSSPRDDREREMKMSSQSTGEVGRVFLDMSNASTTNNNNSNDNNPLPNTSPTGRRKKPKHEKKLSL